MTRYKQSDYELLRRRCAELKDAGWKQVRIAQALGLTEGWVSRTLKKYRQKGSEGLKWRKPKGPARRLTEPQLTELVEELNKGAVYHGFAGEVWTRPRINEVIQKRFGVSYDPSAITRLLQKLGWSRQKPQKKARQQDVQQVAHWQEERLPALKKEPKPKIG